MQLTSKPSPSGAFRLAAGLALLAGSVFGATQDFENDPRFRDPLIVNGERIPIEEIRRQVVLGPLGVESIQFQKLRLHVQAEIDRRVAEGANRADFEVSTEEVAEAIEVAEGQMKDQLKDPNAKLEDLYPTEDDAWKAQVMLTQQFAKVFLPENPYDFPQLTQDALVQGDSGPVLLDHMKQDWDRMQQDIAETGTGTPDPVGATMVKMIVNQSVLKHLDKVSVIETEGLPDDIAMRVNGQNITVDEIWRTIDDRVTPFEVDQARKWITNTTLAEKALREAGKWISDEEIAQIYHDHTEPYKDSPFSIEAVALKFQKFPTVEAYKRYFHIYRSYKRFLWERLRETTIAKTADELAERAAAKQAEILADRAENPQAGDQQTPDELYQEIYEEMVTQRVDKKYDLALTRTSAKRTSRLAGDARLQVDIILLSAYDFVGKRWVENGWEDAEARAVEVIQELDNGLSWKDAVAKYSDFYDPPTPDGAIPRDSDRQIKKDKGRFRAISRNELMKHLSESVYSAFLNNESITDILFFEAKVGEVQAPMKGPHGWYIARLFVRGSPSRYLEIENPSHRELIEQDFVEERMNSWLKALVASNG